MNNTELAEKITEPCSSTGTSLCFRDIKGSNPRPHCNYLIIEKICANFILLPKIMDLQT